MHEFNIYHSRHVAKWGETDVFPCHQCNGFDFLQHIIVYCIAAYNQNKGPLSEINNNHIVTSLFHHKTKQHQTSLNWTEQHRGSTIDLWRLKSMSDSLWAVFFGCRRRSLAQWDTPNLASWTQITTKDIFERHFVKQQGVKFKLLSRMVISKHVCAFRWRTTSPFL